jgi:hypothetical protein
MISRKGSGMPERPFFKDSDLDRMAVEELSGSSLLPSQPAPVRIERFVERRFELSAVCYEDLPTNVLGYTQFGHRGVDAIFVSRTLSEEGSRVAERRINSTLAHEAGHGLLHAYLFRLDSFPTALFGDNGDVTPARILCRDNPSTPGRSAYDGRWWEYQANQMIGALLMPKPLVLAALEPHWVGTGQLGAQSLRDEHRPIVVRELAELFDVNRSVAEIRLDALCPRVSSDQLIL